MRRFADAIRHRHVTFIYIRSLYAFIRLAKSAAAALLVPIYAAIKKHVPIFIFFTLMYDYKFLCTIATTHQQCLLKFYLFTTIV